jgi:uncharacterized protein (DUF488 family)
MQKLKTTIYAGRGSMTRILTIGYEGAQLSEFIRALSEAHVDTLLDVREIPISRRKGFSKTALANAIRDSGMSYVHERRLGSPKPVRNRLKDSKDFVMFFKEYDAYLETQQALLIEMAEDLGGTVALMCYEKDHRQCHRSSVARELGVLMGTEPKHLSVQGPTHGTSVQAKGMRTRQSLSATQSQI